MTTAAVYDSRFSFFRQKTAYDLRISDWNSDVCPSDLAIVRQHRRGRLGIDQPLDPVAHAFRRMRLAAAGRRDGGGEEVLQLEDATGCHDELVAGDPADGDRKSTRLNSSH